MPAIDKTALFAVTQKEFDKLAKLLQDVALKKDGDDASIKDVICHNNDALCGGSVKGAKNAWTSGRWAEATDPSHYRSAIKYVRMRLGKG